MPERLSPAATTSEQPWKCSVMGLFDDRMCLLLGKAE